LGKKAMPVNSHLEWEVPYEAGTLSAKGYRAGKLVSMDKVETTGTAESIVLTPDRAEIKADGEDISVVTVQVHDAQGRVVPTAANDIQFSIEGPGKIIGVGNGDPVSHEMDKAVEIVSQVKIGGAKMKDGGSLGKRDEAAFDVDDSKWPVLFSGRVDDQGRPSTEKPSVRVVRASFELPSPDECGEITLYPKGLVDEQDIYVNGHLIAEKIGRSDAPKAYPLPKSILKKGRNVYAVVGKELLRRWAYEELNLDPGTIRMVLPAPTWKRSLFSGLAQVIVQSDKKAGEILLEASSKGLTSASLKLNSQEVPLRASVP
jgi:beta-galactosidase